MRWEDLPEPVKHQSKRCLKDILATGAGGYKLPPAQQMADLVWASTQTGRFHCGLPAGGHAWWGVFL